MKRWNMTSLAWEEGDSNIPNHNCWEQGKRNYLFSNSITSEPDGTGRGTLTFCNTRGESGDGIPPEDFAIIEERFRLLETEGINFAWRSMEQLKDLHYSNVEYVFSVAGNEHFTDRAINVAKAIAETLGLGGESLTSYLACFEISQETLVRRGKKWIGFGDYLRHRHRLPIFAHYSDSK